MCDTKNVTKELDLLVQMNVLKVVSSKYQVNEEFNSDNQPSVSLLPTPEELRRKDALEIEEMKFADLAGSEIN